VKTVAVVGKIELNEPASVNAAGIKNCLNLALYYKFNIYLAKNDKNDTYELKGLKDFSITLLFVLQNVFRMKTDFEVNMQIAGGMDFLWLDTASDRLRIDCNITAPVFVDDRSQNLLRMIQYDGTLGNKSFTFDPVYYLPLCVREIRDIHIKIISEDNQLVPLEKSSPTVLTLHLRPKRK